MIFKRIETRLAVAVSVLAVAAVAGTALAIRDGARREFFRVTVGESLRASPVTAARAHSVANVLDHRCCPLTGAQTRDLLESGEMALVYDASSHLLMHLDRLSEPVAALEAKRTPRGVDVAADLGGALVRREIHLQLQIPSIPLTLKGGDPGSLFLLHFPTAGTDERTSRFLGALDRRVLAIAGVVAVAAVLLTWMTARRIFNPLRDLGRAMSDLSRGHLMRRVAEIGTDEITLLQRRFNRMAAELGKQEQLRRDLMSDVAHELRTPLTAIRCRLEALIDGLTETNPGALEPLRDDLLHLGNLVDDLQELSLADAREIRLEAYWTAVEPIVQAAVRAAGLESDPRLRSEVGPARKMYVDAIRIRQVITNLLTNAARHTPADGSIVIRSFTRGERTVLEVYNSGSRLEEDQCQRVFERFYRTDPARQRSTGGSGLGLAIVKSLVEAHGGTVWAATQADGVTFGFEVPAGVSTQVHNLELRDTPRYPAVNK